MRTEWTHRAARWCSCTAAACFALAAAAGAASSGTVEVDHAAFDRILGAVVHGERVDYTALREQHLETLERYLDRLAGVDPASLGRDERLAYYVNLYNATMLRAVSQRFTRTYSPADQAFAVFDEPLGRLGDKRVSLNHLEHEIIRKRFGDPRIHAALVCAARSCPPLLPRAYRGDDLQDVLEKNMRRFLNDPARNQIDVKRRRLKLSRIFDWYAEDFGGPRHVAAYVDRYVEAHVADFSVSFVHYDWTLNAIDSR